MKTKLPRGARTFSIPTVLLQVIDRMAYKENQSPSVVVGLLICKALGLDQSIVTDGARKAREVYSPVAVTQVKQMELPWPTSLFDLMQTPYRSKALYNILLTVSKRWGVHDPRNQCPETCAGLDDDKNHPLITAQEKQTLQTLKDDYGVDFS
jgi:hypothetical protein